MSVSGVGLDSLTYATHSMRRTKATLIYRRTGNLLGVEIDDALAVAKKMEV